MKDLHFDVWVVVRRVTASKIIKHITKVASWNKPAAARQEVDERCGLALSLIWHTVRRSVCNGYIKKLFCRWAPAHITCRGLNQDFSHGWRNLSYVTFVFYSSKLPRWLTSGNRWVRPSKSEITNWLMYISTVEYTDSTDLCARNRVDFSHFPLN